VPYVVFMPCTLPCAADNAAGSLNMPGMEAMTRESAMPGMEVMVPS
jgi:hypothetical protein